MPTATTCRTCCRLTRPCTGPTRPAAVPGAICGQPSPAHPAATPARCRWSPTFTARPTSATRAMVMPRPGSCRLPAISQPVMPPRAPGTTSSRTRRRARAIGARHDRLGTRQRRLPIPELAPGFDHVVSRPYAGHDATQRLCRSGRLLHHPRRPG